MQTKLPMGIENFREIRTGGFYYVDKTGLIKTLLENPGKVNLFTRPRRFGKTLNMSMVEQFFSLKYANRGDLFQGLSIWEKEKYRKLQGTYPVLFISLLPSGREPAWGKREKGFPKCFRHHAGL